MVGEIDQRIGLSRRDMAAIQVEQCLSLACDHIILAHAAMALGKAPRTLA